MDDNDFSFCSSRAVCEFDVRGSSFTPGRFLTGAFCDLVVSVISGGTARSVAVILSFSSCRGFARVGDVIEFVEVLVLYFSRRGISPDQALQATSVSSL